MAGIAVGLYSLLALEKVAAVGAKMRWLSVSAVERKQVPVKVRTARPTSERDRVESAPSADNRRLRRDSRCRSAAD